MRMKLNLLVLFLSFIFCTRLVGQFNDDFNDGSLTNNILWSGDIVDFTINDDLALQLSADSAGVSTIYAPIDVPFDSLEISMDIALRFSPSNNNRLEFFVGVDSRAEDKSGYVVTIGENGSDDAIEFYYYDKGVPELLARGIDAYFAKGCDNLTLRLIYMNGLWRCTTLQNFIATEQFQCTDTRMSPQNFQYLGLGCIYTSSRKRNFTFDNIAYQKYAPDILPPQLEEIFPIDGTRVRLVFDEALDIDNSMMTASQINDIDVSSIDSDEINSLIVEAREGFVSDDKNYITLEAVTDVLGNKVRIDTSFLYARPPQIADFIFTEILTDPEGDGSDFIELYNRSTDRLNTSGIKIINRDNDDTLSLESYILLPASYTAISRDTQYLIDRYQPLSTGSMIQADLPPMNNEGATLLLVYNGEVLDSLHYSVESHFDLLSDTEGVTLERVDLGLPFATKDKWLSASSTAHYGTPGYKNSQYIQSDPQKEDLPIKLKTQSISPDGDGMEDVLAIQYKHDEAGYTADFMIYTIEGQQVATLINNQTIDSAGTLYWDGILDNGSRAPTGLYILFVRLTDLKQRSKYYKLPFAVVYPF